MSNKKGDKWERRFRKALSANDPGYEDDTAAIDRFDIDDMAFVEHYVAVRMPASGGGVDYDLPDLHVWLDGGPDTAYQFAVEVKAGRDRVRFDADGIRALERFADATGATPLAFVHIDYTGDYVVHVDDLHVTGGGGRTFTKTRDAPDALPFSEWVKRPTASLGASSMG